MSKRTQTSDDAFKKRSKEKHAQWWQKGPLYHIYPKSFKDSNADGIGDLKGIIDKADYLKSLNITGIWLSPFFKSPMIDHGYDIENYREIDAIFGTLQDFKDLVKTMKNLDIQVIIDFVPNHTSDQHEWFIKSKQKIQPYTDYYIWQKSKNNWMSVFGGSAWTFDEQHRQEYYLHQFYKQQPDLNLRNVHVREELKNVLRFWLDLGVAGFRIDAVPHFFEDECFPDEEVVPNKAPDSYESVTRKYTYNLQPEVNQLLSEFRAVLDEFTNKDGLPRLIMTEAYVGVEDLVEYYGDINQDGIGSISQMPINFSLVSEFRKPEDITGEKLTKVLKSYLEACGSAWPNFSLGNHDSPRSSSRFCSELASYAMNALLLLCPGTPLTYYGEEIGMLDNPGSMDVMSDQRDPCRSPMQWNKSSNAGFSLNSKTWLPLNDSYKKGLNVEDEEKCAQSPLEFYKKLSQLRHHRDFQHVILFGNYEFNVEKSQTTDLFLLKRQWKDTIILLIINLGDESAKVEHMNLESYQLYIKSDTTKERSMEIKAKMCAVYFKNDQ